MIVSREDEILRIVDQIDWYVRCLEDVIQHRVVRGLGEAAAGYDQAKRDLLLMEHK